MLYIGLCAITWNLVGMNKSWRQLRMSYSNRQAIPQGDESLMIELTTCFAGIAECAIRKVLTGLTALMITRVLYRS